jgi:hypothetical protein
MTRLEITSRIAISGLMIHKCMHFALQSRDYVRRETQRTNFCYVPWLIPHRNSGQPVGKQGVQCPAPWLWGRFKPLRPQKRSVDRGRQPNQRRSEAPQADPVRHCEPRTRLSSLVQAYSRSIETDARSRGLYGPH